MRAGWIGVALAWTACAARAQRAVTIPALRQSATIGQSERIRGDLYGGSGARGVVLAHGGRFNKQSWARQARVLADAGFEVLAIDFRGDRLNPDGSPSAEGSDADNAADVLAAVRYLHSLGVRHVFAVGGSLGGDAVGNADVQAKPGEIERMVFLASDGGDAPEKLTGRKLYLVARDDANDDGPRIVPIRAHYARAPQPKKLVVVEGTAHAQALFETAEGPRVMNEILRFVSKK